MNLKTKRYMIKDSGKVRERGDMVAQDTVTLRGVSNLTVQGNTQFISDREIELLKLFRSLPRSIRDGSNLEGILSTMLLIHQSQQE